MSSDPAFIVERGLSPDRMPDHVAIIMDGNGRWAKKRLMNRVKGHERGVEVVREIVRLSRNLGLDFLTLYAFSTENWARPRVEIMALMALLKRFLKSERREMLDNNIRLNVLGQPWRLPEDVQAVLDEVMTATGDNDGMVLNLALSYGSRSEITEAVRAIARKVKAGEVEEATISEAMIADHLYTGGMADPDLMIRTSGELRISNFLLWQVAYAEFFFTETLWPDFGEGEYIEILRAYQQRRRRFGKVESP